MKRLAACVLVLCWTGAAAQGPNGILLIAKPGLTDPNFSRTVVLVTRAGDSGTVGVIVNRPTTLKLPDFAAEPGLETGKYRDQVYLGGPIMRNALVALFESGSMPAAPAFHVLGKLYLTMHPDNMQALLSSEGPRYRLYAGFSGWAPRQLESELEAEGWFVMPVDTDIIFRADTSGIWEELVNRAQAQKTRWNLKSPAKCGLGVPGRMCGAGRHEAHAHGLEGGTGGFDAARLLCRIEPHRIERRQKAFPAGARLVAIAVDEPGASLRGHAQALMHMPVDDRGAQRGAFEHIRTPDDCSGTVW